MSNLPSVVSLRGKAEVGGGEFLEPPKSLRVLNESEKSWKEVSLTWLLSKMTSEHTTNYDYRLVDSDTGLQDAISDIKQKIAERIALLAVDCEGNSLSREGEPLLSSQ